MIELALADQAATEALGAAVADSVEAGDVVLLIGELGAGKTTFTRGLVERLGGGSVVTSPTFTLCQEYATAPPVVHVDCWRLDTTAEIVDLGLDEHLDDGACVIAEWGERAMPVIGEDALIVSLSYDGDGRCVTVSANGVRSAARLGQLAALVGSQA